MIEAPGSKSLNAEAVSPDPVPSNPGNAHSVPSRRLGGMNLPIGVCSFPVMDAKLYRATMLMRTSCRHNQK
jgi:hypothetical protein